MNSDRPTESVTTDNQKQQIRKKRFKKNGNNDCPVDNGQRLPHYPNSMKYR